MIKLIAIITTDNFPKLLQSNTRLNVANQIKDYIDAGNGMGMTLDNFSKIFFYDKFYMERKFKEAFGINLIEYRNKKRMEFECLFYFFAKRGGFESPLRKQSDGLFLGRGIQLK